MQNPIGIAIQMHTQTHTHKTILHTGNFQQDLWTSLK